MKLFSIFFFIGLPIFVTIIYGYFHLGGIEGLFEYYKNTAFNYGIYHEPIDTFQITFHFYMLLFLSVFFTFWGGLMSGIIKLVYLPLFLALIFGVVGYHIDILTTQYYITSAILVGVFFFMAIKVPHMGQQLPFIQRISNKRKQEFAKKALIKTGEFHQVITDYSVQINKRPGQRAIYKTIHPLTEKVFFAKTQMSFDPYFSSKLPSSLNIYFDRHNPEKYICSTEDIYKNIH